MQRIRHALPLARSEGYTWSVPDLVICEADRNPLYSRG
jgi:hypothetical protein